MCVCVCEWSARKTTCLYFTFEVLCIHFVDRVKHVCSPQSVRYAIEMATTNIMMMMIIIIITRIMIRYRTEQTGLPFR